MSGPLSISMGASGAGPGQTKPIFDRSIYGRPMGVSLEGEQQQRITAARAKRPVLVVMTPRKAPSAPHAPLHLVSPESIKALVEQNRRRIDAGRVRVSPIAMTLTRPVLTLGDPDHV
jgi:hypothetical protein